MNSNLVAVVGEAGFGKTGGEQYDARLLAAAKRSGFTVDYITWGQSRFDKIMSVSILWRFRYISRTLWLTWKVWRSSGDIFVDVWMAPYLMFWARFSRRSIILMVHHLRFHLESGRVSRAWVLQGEKQLVNRATRILTVSQSSQRQVQGLLTHEVPIDIIPPGFKRLPMPFEQKKQGHSEVIFLFVGHITKAKGVLDLVQAVSLLPKNSVWKLYIVGSTQAEPNTAHAVQLFLQQHGLEKQVELYGRVSNNRLQSLYQTADVFVLPSYWEGYGIVFLEAMAMGLPVISTTAGAIPEVVAHGKTGLLVKSGDTQALALALETLLDSEDKRQSFSEKALALVKSAPDWQQVEVRFD
ncbi:MAG: glycosyltransferase family 4 protein, partial [Ghiorsea sp.]